MGRKPVIAIAGLHGVGKTVFARAVAEKYDLRYISAGTIFRSLARERGMTLIQLSELAKRDYSIDKKIDEQMAREARAGGCVLDGLLVAWMAGGFADLSVWLKAPLEVRIKRVYKREGGGMEGVLEETLARERAETERFKTYYGIDLNDLSVYDIVIDTSKFTLEGVKRIIFAAVDDVITRRFEQK